MLAERHRSFRRNLGKNLALIQRYGGLKRIVPDLDGRIGSGHRRGTVARKKLRQFEKVPVPGRTCLHRRRHGARAPGEARDPSPLCRVLRNQPRRFFRGDRHGGHAPGRLQLHVARQPPEVARRHELLQLDDSDAPDTGNSGKRRGPAWGSWPRGAWSPHRRWRSLSGAASAVLSWRATTSVIPIASTRGGLSRAGASWLPRTGWGRRKHARRERSRRAME